MTASVPVRIAPHPSPLTAPFWDAARRGELALPYCTSCGKPHFYPRSRCPFCHRDTLEWRQASGRGTVYSFTIVYRAPSEAFADEVPYVVAAIALEEGPHLMSRIIGPDALDVRVGDPVTVSFIARGGPDDPPLPCFSRTVA